MDFNTSEIGSKDLSSYLREVNNFDLNAGNPASFQSYSLGRGSGYIYNTTVGIRTPIINPYMNVFPVPKIGDFDNGTERKPFMGAGKSVFIEALAASRLSSVKLASVPRRVTVLDIILERMT